MRFWCKFGATLYATILTISNSTLKSQRDNFDLGSKLQKALRITRSAFCYLLDEPVGKFMAQVNLCP